MEGLLTRLADQIRALDESGAVELAARLAQAERSRLSLPLEAVEFSHRVKAKDGGVDGRTSFPTDAETPFPKGKRVWQVKSGATAVSAQREFAPPKRGGDKWVVEELRTGEVGYVLFWTYDPVDRDAEGIRNDFRDEVRRIAPGVEVTFLFLSQIVELARRHPGVALDALGLDGAGVLSVEEWARLFEGVFEPDAGREAVVNGVRDHVTGGAAPHLLRLYGDAGVGSSRTIFEAINVDGIRERTLVASGGGIAVAELVAHDPQASAVLVVDPATEGDIVRLHPFIAAAAGRLRVVAVQDPDPTSRPAPDQYVVDPLAPGAIRRLLDPANGGTKADESLVVLAGGYPGLALQIRAVATRQGPGTELVAVARDPDVRQRLRRLVPDPEALHALAALAPFGRVGVNGPSADEYATIAEALGRDRLADSTRLSRFKGRLLTASRDRLRVSPEIVAIWLSEEALQTFGTRLLDAADRVPDHLALALVDRLATMPGSEAARQFVQELAQRDRFKVIGADRLDTLRTRTLLAIAILNPRAGLGMLSAVTAELSGGVPADVLATIEELLWDHETFQDAAAILFELALADTATRTYGPRMLFEQTFQLALSGTTETYVDRLAVARRLGERSDARGRCLVAEVLSGAFDLTATRTVSLRGRATMREDWYPTPEEQRASLTAAWGLLLELARESEVQETAARSLAHAIRACLRTGLDELVETELGAIDWAGRPRATLIHECRVARDHDRNLSDPQRELLDRVLRQLEGDDFHTRLVTAMGAEPYQLESYTAVSEETFLVRLADDMAANADHLRGGVVASINGNAQTVGRLFYHLGRRTDDAVFSRLLDPPASASAQIGFISGRDSSGSMPWSTERIREWLDNPEFRQHVPALVNALSPSDERVRLAIAAVDAGASPYDLSLLAYGSRAEKLEADTIVEAIHRLEAHPGVIREHALAIALNWLEGEDRTATPSLVAAVLRLIDASIDGEESQGTGMMQFYRTRILERVPDDAPELLRRVTAILKSDRVSDDDAQLICRAAALDRDATIQTIISLVADAVGGTGQHLWAWHLSRLNLLSVLASCTDPDAIGVELEERGLDPASLFGHVAVEDGAGGLDPMFAKLLRMGGDSERVRASAAWAYQFPSGAHWGPESDHLRTRAEAAGRLAREVADPPIQHWAEWTAGALTERAKEALRRETSEDDEPS
ncbi:MAG TPA: hypothetical protein VGQ02_06855 [Candidatus Limnocylindrales bacterium]|nr:hypothetical protein [Candidatus Limnocylindrales bacterium]